MPLNSNALGATLSMLAVAAVVTAAPVLAQQNPPPGGSPPSGPSGQPGAPPPQAAPVRPGAPRYALAIANVNLRSGPGTDSPLITTIPGGSNVVVNGCSGEWCSVMWNGHSGYAIARNLDTGGPREARQYRPQPGYAAEPDHEPGPPVVYGAPGYYPPPPVVYGPGYYGPGYYGPGYYGPGWGWGRRW
ncbi:MAG: SH3 domain-containing protein [Xanthobacteraceae bacterium]